MLGDQKPYNIDVQGVTVECQPFSELERCLACFVGGQVFLRVSLIDTPQKAQELYKILIWIQDQQKKRQFLTIAPFRAVSWQLNMPDLEWDLIRTQHYHLLKAGQENGSARKIAHLNLPTDFVFQHQDRPARTLLMLKTIHKLEKQLNTEGWLFYSDWINEDMENIFRTFSPDAADEFQLEASIKDFEHEMTSYLLNNYRRKINELVAKIGGQEFDALRTGSDLGFTEMVELEKELIKVRGEVKSNLQFQHKVLEETVSRIIKIEKNHPELWTLKQSAILLKELLADQADVPGSMPMSWIKELILMTLLEINLGAISVLNCDSGLDRTGIASALKLGVIELSQGGHVPELIDIALMWDLIVPDINKLVAKMGAQSFEAWKNEPHENRELSLKRINWVDRLRESVLDNLALFSKQLPHPNIKWHEGITVHKEFLNLIPPYKQEGGELKPLVNYDPATGMPLELTAYGNQFFSRYFSFVA